MFNPLDIIGKGIEIVGGVLKSDVVSNIGKMLTGDKVPPEQKAELEKALSGHVEEMKRLANEELRINNDKMKIENEAMTIQMEELRLALDESKEMIKSQDKFVSRARPMSIYAAIILTSFMVVVVGVILLQGKTVDWAGVASVNSLIIPLWGHAAWYSHNRTKEKMSKIEHQV